MKLRNLSVFTRRSAILVTLGCAVVVALYSTLAFGGSNRNAKIACHLVEHTTRVRCASAPRPPCNQGEKNFVIQGDTHVSYDLYLMVVDGDPVSGVACAKFGISYDGAPRRGVDILQWTLCADTEYGSHRKAPSWPNAGSGNSVIWDAERNCQEAVAVGDKDGGVTAVIGVLNVYAYSNDVFSVTKHPMPPQSLSVFSCGISPDTLGSQSMGGVAFGSAVGGHDPCK
jgi:hypothetical protein